MVLSCHLALLHDPEVIIQCLRTQNVYVIFQEALKTCCLHGIQIKYFSGQFHCFSDCVVNNNLRKTKYSVALHVFNGGKHSIFCEF